mgnify:CR=1 FL=1
MRSNMDIPHLTHRTWAITKTLEEISAYTYKSKSSGEQEYIEDKTGKKCIL